MRQFYSYDILAALTFFMSSIGNAQTLKEANDLYNSYAYAEAGEVYEKVLKKDKNKSKVALIKLGDSYYFTGKYIKALQLYDLMMKMPGEVNAIYYFRYSQCLRANAEYVKSDNALLQYYNMIGREEQIKDKIEKDYLEEIKHFEATYKVTRTKINSMYSDFGPSFYGKDKLIFASARPEKENEKTTHAWSGEPFTKLYVSTIKTDGSLEKPVLLSREINAKYNQSSVAITKDGNTMYFTRNNYLKNKLGISDAGINYLKIYRATKVDGEWINIEDLSINGVNHSNGHPALSPDDKFLYYASDKMGGYGDTDIYVVEILEDGRLKTPVNLGDQINTMHKETFPFVSESGILYFSSNGHLGRGGLDVFAAYKDINTEKYHVYNVGGEINSTADDFGFIINENNKRGYFTSNRGRGSRDDIYSFQEELPLMTAFEIRAKFDLIDSLTLSKLSDVEISIYDNKNNLVDKVRTEEDGSAVLTLSELDKYKFKFNKKGYVRDQMVTNISKKGLHNFDIKLLPESAGELTVVYGKNEIAKLLSGDDLMKKLDLKPIYYDYGGDNLRLSSKRELDKVIAIMREYPEINIEIRSHTDSRSSAGFNLGLSKKRAQAAVNYVVKEGGILSNRVSGKGYGEAAPVNHCKKGVKCSEQEYILNRRLEIIASIL